MEGAQKPVIAFLGPRATYTHQATLDFFNEEDYTLSPQHTIEDVFSAVQSGTAHRGVIPFENSTNGSVVFTLDLFADVHRQHPDIVVCGESFIPVSHSLLGYCQRHAAPPIAPTSGDVSTAISGGVTESPSVSGTAVATSKASNPEKPLARPMCDLARVKKIISHPQAWGQCKPFLNTYLKGVERQDATSTARAAELVAQEGKNSDIVAISSGIAAQEYGLDTLATGIEERANNVTRFFIVGKGASVGGGEKKEKQRYKTLISFTVDHGNPGALAHALTVFERFGLNLTSINTRPSGIQNWNYIFFVEVLGRREEEGGREGGVNGALGELERVCRGCRWLGSWESRLPG